jgi:two-component system response regulator QseB
MLRDLLSDDGYTVDVATDGQSGLHRGLVGHYDVVVLDRRLPVIDGLDLLGGWRRSGVTTPVLVLSALGNPVERVELPPRRHEASAGGAFYGQFHGHDEA